VRGEDIGAGGPKETAAGGAGFDGARDFLFFVKYLSHGRAVLMRTVTGVGT